MTNVPAIQISSRAQNLMNESRFALSPVIAPGPQWKIEYGRQNAQWQTDRILTLQYSHPSSDSLETLFYESICRVSQQKTLSDLFKLSFREIESFLRDENHLPAFGNEIAGPAQEVFGRLKNALILEILSKKISMPKGKTWKELGLAEKNRAVMELFSSLCSLFPKDKNLELVLAESDTVTVKKNDFPLELDALEALLCHQFGAGSADSPLKVIGTL